ncbi:putative lost on transformation protein 1 [Operophtera brumata]|uniref:Putative lost on transformation protein 1 n=1 Tax=Operophtera brumata TaxID=104452 RepID=A0A0L7LVR8_OPEBR|nr:putative lost on transformation protein 1 [Operophtera brumata]
MASPPPNPRQGEEGGPQSQEADGQRAAAPQKRFIAPPASQLPSKLSYVTFGLPGPSGGIKQLYRTVKMARRVPTLPRNKLQEDEGGGPSRPGPSAAPEPPAPIPARAAASDVVPIAGAEASRRARRDTAKRHACNTCNKRFTSPGKLSQHVLSHTGELPFPCEFCEKRFNSKFKLARHNLIHSEARAFACNVCYKTFNRKDHLTNHVRVHNPVKKLYTCEKPDCRKSYTSQMSYRKHAALHSAEEGNLQCKICDKVFTNHYDIVYHLKVHTGSRTVKDETDKKFTCDFCDRRFFTAKDVKRHLVVHTGRRDFLCPYCPQKFGRKDHLVRHVKNAHPEESWRSAAVGTSSEPAPEASAFEETYTDYTIEITETVETPTPSLSIVVPMPSELDIKVEPEEIEPEEPEVIKLEQPASPQIMESEFQDLVFVMPQEFQASELDYITTQELPAEMEPDMLNPTLLIDPGEGPSGLSNQMLRGLLEDRESRYASEEGASGRVPQRLPAFTQAFHTAQSPKPPPPPPPPH